MQRKVKRWDKATIQIISDRVRELLITNAENDCGTFCDGQDFAFRKVLRIISDIFDEQ